MDALASPPPTSCGKCGDHFRRPSDAMFHICRPNGSDFKSACTKCTFSTWLHSRAALSTAVE